ncbi:MAG TPA: lmo0937 family membrane protein [Ferruginibacter sp.]|nr:lmo0937 family membrane protein [Ferruginibacter sp.]HPH93000.1 lmo0937 family membrane protein [Ferruginibacter sp.]
MSNILYLVAVVLIIGWLIGVFAYSVGGIIHVLLVIAVIAIIYNLVTGRKAL